MMVGLPPNWQTGGLGGGSSVDRGVTAVGPAVADKCNVVKWLKEHGYYFFPSSSASSAFASNPR